MFPVLNNLIMAAARKPLRLGPKPSPTLLSYGRYYQLLHHPSTKAFLGYCPLIAPTPARGAAAHQGKAPETSTAKIGTATNAPLLSPRPVTPTTASFTSSFPPITPRSPAAAFAIPPLSISALAPEKPSASASTPTAPGSFVSSQYALAHSVPTARLSLIFSPHSLSPPSSSSSALPALFWPLQRALAAFPPVAPAAPIASATAGLVSNSGASTSDATCSSSSLSSSSLSSLSAPQDPPVTTTLALPKARMRLLSSRVRASNQRGDDNGDDVDARSMTAAPTTATATVCGTSDVGGAALSHASELRETLARFSRARVALDHFVPAWVKK